MKISRITKQKRANNRYNVFLDDGHGDVFGFSVDEDLLVKYHLRKGLTLSSSLIRTLKQQDTFHRSYTQAIHYLSFRMRSSFEVEEYLRRKDVDEEHIVLIINKLNEEGIIDDRAFAHMFVKDRIQRSYKGPNVVKKELAVLKGISAELASEAVEQFTYDIQYERAMKVAEKRMSRKRKHSFQKELQQLQAALTRNGFTRSVIEDIVEEYRSYKDDSKEWETLCKHGERLLKRYKQKFSGFTLTQKLKEGLYRQGFSIENINKFLYKQNINE